MTPIRLILTHPANKLPGGASRFWGNPDLPDGTPYPMYTDDDGDPYPYFFICQINLRDIAPYDVDGLLPHTGLLSFFAKIDRYLGMYDDTDCISGYISSPDDVKVLYFPESECGDMREVVLIDDDDEPTSPAELQIDFSLDAAPLTDDHMLLAPPDHREWASWDAPCEGWEILLQVDSFDGPGFNLNFMDTGVLDILISPADLRDRRFDRVRAIVLST